jgi:hypothetical protein
MLFEVGFRAHSGRRPGTDTREAQGANSRIRGA